jgi:very-short-patch-repair endonuclease
MTMGIGALEILGDAKAGRVTTVFCSDVALGRSQIRAAAEELDPLPTLVALEWVSAPSLAHELDEIRDALADAALTLWPNWYVTAEKRFTAQERTVQDLHRLATKVGVTVPGASTSWLKEASKLCELRHRPVVEPMVAAEQVRQLALAIDPNRLVFALSVHAEEATSARIKALAHAAEWLAAEARAKTILLLPATWAGRGELDHVTYGAITLTRDETTPALDEPTDAPPSVHDLGSGELSPRAEEPLQIVVGPVTGKPHPASEVEKLVYQELMADAELRNLFEANQRLMSFGEKPYIVDLLWRAGQLIIEIDGPEHHGHMAYVRDRDRDYRFLVSGYQTLRIANAEVYADVERVLGKIRHVVRTRLSPKKAKKN